MEKWKGMQVSSLEVRLIRERERNFVMSLVTVTVVYSVPIMGSTGK